ncbi:penicillin-binding protein 2 [Microbacterium sp. LRZ72]|uniref:peptidoglycan D,D-transpeptidase FtsI family protein n=1 Tax=Microbacterium sp. LRZ72 TaxID=2942481 RepID=UPI0029ACDD51|nr:penicillin-binding protein 2 [Microbacterium sp. LRZ72]MDX2377167.1 penicillin-binding protein 2 [Microbacterium sp. LRZ72]
MSTRATRSPRRRTVVALAVVLAVLVAFVIRLVDIQVVNAESLRADSLGVGIGGERTLYGARGTIVDETGAELAGNVVEYDWEFNPQHVADIERDGPDGEPVVITWPEQAEKIAAITGQTPEEVEQIVADALAANPDTQWAQLATGLTTDQHQALRELGYPYLTYREHPARTYTDGAVAGNLLGFVGADAEPLAGLEASEDACLAASNGTESYARGKDGVVIPGTLNQTPAVDGGTLQLTINRDLQWYLQQMIAEEVQRERAEYGTVTVVEVDTGKVRAAAEYPSVDPNDPTASPVEDRGSRIFSAHFEPGSTFKPITAATLIEEGAATPLTPTVSASGRETFPNGVTINDIFSHPAYTYTLAGALVDSSNVALSKFGTMVSDDVRHDYLADFGVGAGTAIGFPGEASGILNPTPWDDASHFTTTFGQYFTVTAPQVASVYQTIANRGVRVPLTLVESCTTASGEVIQPDVPEPERVISEDTAADVTLMLENVYQQVANHDVLAVDGYRMATKSGTAQKPDGEGGYKQGIFYTTLAGFAPADDPEYVVILTLDEPKKNRASAANAPGFQKAMTQVLKTFRVLPSEEEGPEILPKYR